MKTLNRLVPDFTMHIVHIAGLILILWITGCNSTGYRKGDAAAASLRGAAAEVRTESRAIESTLSALNKLVFETATDAKPQYIRFSAALDDLVRAANRTENSGKRFAQKNSVYFEAWENELSKINYEAVRERGEARRVAMTNQFGVVNRRYQEAAQVVGPLIVYLEDIRKALGTDLTTEGIQSIRPIAANAERNARIVQNALAALSEELAVMSGRMSSVAERDAKSSPETATLKVR